MQATLNRIQRAVTDFNFSPDEEDTLVEVEIEAMNCIMENVDGFETYNIVETNNHFTSYVWVQDFNRTLQKSGELISGSERNNRYYVIDDSEIPKEIKWFEVDDYKGKMCIYIQLDKDVDVYGKVCLLLAEWC